MGEARPLCGGGSGSLGLAAMLIAFGGLPGSGKTTVARALARQLAAVHVRIDTIEQALLSSGVLKGDVGPAGYAVGYGIAEDNLRLGRVVVADSVNPVRASRDGWLEVARRAGVRAAEVEVICSDAAEHRRRVESRTGDIEGLKLPTWQAVADRYYENWDRPHIVVDTARLSAEEQAMALVDRLELR
jgi:predicted kinase